MVSHGLKIPDVITKALERLRLSKWVPHLVHAYEKETADPFDEYATMFAVERAEGKEKGKLEEKREIALNLLAQNVDIKVISVATGLSEEEIETLKSALEEQ